MPPIVRAIDQEPYEDNMDPEIHDKEDERICPVCGEEAEWLYIDDWGMIAGCDKCLHERYVG